jgi:hypothetical protein
MKKTELKRLLKPLVKECIHEVLLEEGLLSTVVSEVTKGMQPGVIMEQKTASPQPERAQMKEQARQSREQVDQYRKSLMESIGHDAFKGVNLFEGTEPATSTEALQGHPDLGSPADAGVDISSIMGHSNKIWEALK